MNVLVSLLIPALAMAAASAEPPACVDPIPAAGMLRFHEMVGAKQYVVLGEAGHMQSAVHCMVGQVFRSLAEHKGYRLIVFESAWGIDDGMKDFLSGDRTELTPQESFLLNAFNSKATRELLVWIRDWNRRHPADVIRVAGVQPEQPVTDFQALFRHLPDARAKAAPCKASSEEFKTDIDFISFTSKMRRKEKKPAFEASELKACLAALDGMEAQLKKKKASAEALLHVDSLRNYYRVLAPVADSTVSGRELTPEQTLKMGADTYTRGDEARFRIFDKLRQTRYAGLKALLWMHNWHAAKHSEDLVYEKQIPAGTVSLGVRLAKAYGQSLLTVGNVIACPDCRTAAPPDAIEKKFETMFGGRAAFVDGKALEGAGTLLDALYRDRLQNVVLSRQFDGVFYLPYSSRTMEEDKPRYVHTPDLKTILPRFLTKQGFLDPEFAVATAKASPWYTDFYGIQALMNVTGDQIKKDFLPDEAKLISEDEHAIRLQFKAGWTGTFYPHSALSVMGALAPFDHMEASGETWRDILNNLDDFRAVLKRRGLENAYLVPNPYYQEELAVEKRWKEAPLAAKIAVEPKLESLDRPGNAVWLAPEGVHGRIESYNALVQAWKGHKLDWFGMEMLITAQQLDLDAFPKSRQKLVDYFATSWNGRAGPKTTGEENYYFKLVEQMRAAGTRVIALEDVGIAYIFFRYGENPFGGAVRSLLWVKAVPAGGKGAIFGGSGHFTDARPVNVQDFLTDLAPGAKLISVSPIAPRKQ